MQIIPKTRFTLPELSASQGNRRVRCGSVVNGTLRRHYYSVFLFSLVILDYLGLDDKHRTARSLLITLIDQVQPSEPYLFFCLPLRNSSLPTTLLLPCRYEAWSAYAGILSIISLRFLIMATLAPSSSPPSPSRRRTKTWARRCERVCWKILTAFPLAFVYGLTTWAVWVQANIGFAPFKHTWTGMLGQRV